jgi:class 3 adenylate cyclase
MTPRPPGTLTTATILFTDVVDSTGTRTRLGEELADRHLRHYDQLIRAIATVHGSVFNRSLGDGLMAVFESATAALEAVTAIQYAIATEQDEAVEALAIRAALSAGDVVWAEDDVRGLPTVQAARLLTAAQGDQVLCTDLVQRLAQGRGRHEFKELLPVPAKGLPAPMPTYELLWRNRDQAETGRLPAWLDGDHLLPLLGRDDQLAALDDDLMAARFGARVVMLRGAAGAGKTRLAAALARRAVGQRFTVLSGRCTDPASQAYQPIADALERLVEASPELLLRAGLDERAGQLVRLVPRLASPPFGLTIPPPADPVSELHQLLAAVRTLVRQLTDVQPVLFVVDDLHWATAESLQMLEAVVRHADGLPLLIVTTARDEAFDPASTGTHQLRRFAALPEVRMLTVGELAVGDVAAALAAVDGCDPEEAEGDAARLHWVTGGNAFLVTEMLRDRARGEELDLDSLAVPDCVARFVAARLAPLGPEARNLVGLVAAGEQLDPAALTLALGLDDSGFVAAVEEAEAAGLLTFPAGGSCQFTHELIRNAVYRTLSTPRAAMLHRRVADSLRRADPAMMQTRPYLVASQLVAATQYRGDQLYLAEAAEAVEHAARHALDRLAHQEAVAWFELERGLQERIEDLPAERRAELLVACGKAMWLAGHPEARASLLEAAGLARSCGRHDLVVAAALAGDRGFFSVTAATDPERVELLAEAGRLASRGDLRTRALLAAQLASELTWAPDGGRRFELSDQALELARRSGEAPTLVAVLGLRNLTISAADTLERRRRDGDEMLDAARRTGDPLALFHATFQRTGPWLEVGDTARVAELLDEADQLARRLAQPHLIWLVSFSRAGLALMRGEIAVAEAEAARALRLGTEVGRGQEALLFHVKQLAEIRRLQGRLGELAEGLRAASATPQQPDPAREILRYLCELGAEEAAPVLDRTVATFGVLPRRDLAERAALDNLALAASRLGRDDLVPPLYEALSPYGETFGHSVVAHHCGHHFLAHLAAAGGRGAQAGAHFEAAAAVHRRAGVPLLLAESLLDWAELIDRGTVAGPDAAGLRDQARASVADRGAVLLERRLELVRR